MVFIVLEVFTVMQAVVVLHSLYKGMYAWQYSLLNKQYLS